jgi:hypothetical protein
MASCLGNIPSLTQILSKNNRVLAPANLAHAVCLSAASSMNVALPILLFGSGIYSQLLNLGLRVTFVCETILTGKITHRGDIGYAHSKKSLAYIAFVFSILLFFSLFAIGLLPLILNYLLPESSAAVEFRYLEVSRLLVIIFSVSLISLFRLFYTFNYYKLANILSVRFLDGSSPRISMISSSMYLIFWIIYLLSLHHFSHWSARVLMLILPQVTLLAYSVKQVKYAFALVKTSRSVS